MADNYLENKFEEYKNGTTAKDKLLKKKKTAHKSLNDLLIMNRSCRGYDHNYKVSMEELHEIIETNTRIPSAKNQQVLRFKPVLGEDAAIITGNVKLGALLAELNLPFKGTEPEAYIIICSTIAENKWVDIDLGISVQSMLLKAVEMGLNGVCIGAFNKEAITRAFSLPYEPQLIIAVGKSIEKFQLLGIHEDESHAYYRKDGIHYVPKVSIDDLIL